MCKSLFNNFVLKSEIEALGPQTIFTLKEKSEILVQNLNDNFILMNNSDHSCSILFYFNSLQQTFCVTKSASSCLELHHL